MTSRQPLGPTGLVRNTKLQYTDSSLPTHTNRKCSDTLPRNWDWTRPSSLALPSNLWLSSTRAKNSSQKNKYKLFSKRVFLVFYSHREMKKISSISPSKTSFPKMQEKLSTQFLRVPPTSPKPPSKDKLKVNSKLMPLIFGRKLLNTSTPPSKN